MSVDKNRICASFSLCGVHVCGQQSVCCAVHRCVLEFGVQQSVYGVVNVFVRGGQVIVAQRFFVRNFGVCVVMIWCPPTVFVFFALCSAGAYAVLLLCF